MKSGPEAFETPAAKATGAEVFDELFHEDTALVSLLVLVLPHMCVLFGILII